jgi:hypothetical protein
MSPELIAAIEEIDRELRALTAIYPTLPLRNELDGPFVAIAKRALSNAIAVTLLMQHPQTQGAAASNARTSFEAAADAMYLAVQESYPRAVARMRVFEEFEVASTGAEMGALAYPHGQAPADGTTDVFANAEAIARKAAVDSLAAFPDFSCEIDLASTEFGALFRSVRKKRDEGKTTAYPLHWSGLGFSRRAAEIGEKLGDMRLDSLLRVSYSQLSRGSHPRIGLHERRLPGDTAHVITCTDTALAVSVVRLACNRIYGEGAVV